MKRLLVALVVRAHRFNGNLIRMIFIREVFSLLLLRELINLELVRKLHFYVMY